MSCIGCHLAFLVVCRERFLRGVRRSMDISSQQGYVASYRLLLLLNSVPIPLSDPKSSHFF